MKKQTKPKIEIDLKQVEALAANGLTMQQIADSLGISRTTLQMRKAENEQFEQAIKRGKAKGIAIVTNKLMGQIKSGNTTAMIFFLKSQAGWKETQITEHAGINGAPIEIKQMNKEDYAEVRRQMLKEDDC
ncbi:LuxR family transcriptional regulator [Rodentibacter rarus]|uniref:LuxR family transcriptional regulator n=1 Tax=Rodentibacter rarus TaxID=1908260 RepID=UPI000985E3C8|nr:LuxR family transcriptional regulator [Rodentibacter rarus]OOF39887.1 LuxR family transcriptional regulator [Rodentibacter rarus]